jgi:hypothetical protein
MKYLRHRLARKLTMPGILCRLARGGGPHRDVRMRGALVPSRHRPRSRCPHRRSMRRSHATGGSNRKRYAIGDRMLNKRPPHLRKRILFRKSRCLQLAAPCASEAGIAPQNTTTR